MRLFRFMAKEEYEKYQAGETLVNTTNHQADTNSTGFCFIDEEDYHPAYAYQFLSGIVDDYICCVFETEKQMSVGIGTYADPYEPETIGVEEYYTSEYNKKDFTLVESFQYEEIKSW